MTDVSRIPPIGTCRTALPYAPPHTHGNQIPRKLPIRIFPGFSQGFCCCHRSLVLSPITNPFVPPHTVCH